MRGKKRHALACSLCVYLPHPPHPFLSHIHTNTRRHSDIHLPVCLCVRLVLPYEEHLRAGGVGANFKIPESPAPPKPRAMRGRKPLPRGRRPGTKSKEKNTSAASPPPVSN